jgi:hypothetical protein
MVTNGSTAVVGTGTQFDTAKPGDRIMIEGEALPYAIGAITTATELVLDRAFAGASASGLSYELIPTQERFQELAASFEAILAQFQAKLDAVGVPVAGEVELIAGAVSQLHLAAGVASGSAVQTGADDTTPGRLALAQHVFSRGNLLGTTSESGGVPTGAVIESGSNANGKYVRFADGTQICTGYFGTPAESHAWVFPAAFASTAGGALTFATQPTSATAVTVTVDFGMTATGCTFEIWDAAGAAASRRLYVTALGRWF